MRIVNRETFLSLPAGTVFTKFTPHAFGELCVKGDRAGTNDFWYQPLSDSVRASDTEEWFSVMEAALKSGAEVAFDFDCESRDGMFDEGQLFAVWSAVDVSALIDRLQRALDEQAKEARNE